MFKTMIAGVTALALTTAPLQAQEFDNDNLGKFLFGLVAAVALGTALSKNSDDAPAAQTVHQPQYEPPVVRDRTAPRINPRAEVPSRAPIWHGPGGLQPRAHEPRTVWPRGNGFDQGHIRQDRALPAACFYTARTRHGPQDLFGYRCLQRNYAQAHALPGHCLTRVRTPGGVHNGYLPRCLRSEGYRISHRY